MKIRTAADIAEIEKVPVADRIRHRNVLDLVRAAGAEHAARIAIRYLAGTGPSDPVRDVTFEALLRHTLQAANLLHAEGIGPDDTVTLLLPSVPETFFALWGAEVAAVANPVNYFLDASQIAGIMKEAGAKALIAADPSLFADIWPKVEAIRAAMPGLRVFRVGGGNSPPVPGVIEFEAACARQPGDRPIAPRTLARDTVAALFHTGGTTGLPKLARHTHGALTLAAWSNALFFDLGPGAVLLNPLPQFHVGGSIFGALSAIASGWTVVIPTPLGARNPNVVRDYWGIVERNRVTVGGAVPTTLAAIMNVPREGHDLSSLACFVTGGSTVPIELIRRIEREIGVPVVEGYGMTEVHCYSTMNPPHGERRPGSVGLRLPYTEVRIADVAPDGTIRRDCAPGEIGHVLMRGPQVTPGYLNPHHDKGAMLADGWLDSGDLGRLDAEGYVWLTGRSKDLIIRGGHNIDPVVIEEALSRHPAVETAAAVGLPDTYAGELPMAFVQLKPDAAATPDELREFCRKEIPERAAVPVQVVPIPVMPVTGVGKIFKPALRLEAAQRAFDAALAPLRAESVKAEVAVRNDATYGTLAEVRIDDEGKLSREAIGKRCADLLGGFQIRYALEF
ncbi:acyl-CoA synthetase [Enhydrobacter sp.]|jgi:fatty-acyl-CoA synthase|uniref:acyl-CoA synthetase n=1 Tax=Enhydrobacter sp. TaxID=1894999 RepID=UPI00261871C1|nr:acyl-CoA synthetase [Enhydrobacter sp.]WIM11333.1 MAG: Long-chain-fatty-acid--CoA ligase [Enhydrobacter sp.]